MSVCPHLTTVFDGFRWRDKDNKWDGKKATEREKERERERERARN